MWGVQSQHDFVVSFCGFNLAVALENMGFQLIRAVQILALMEHFSLHYSWALNIFFCIVLLTDVHRKTTGNTKCQRLSAVLCTGKYRFQGGLELQKN